MGKAPIHLLLPESDWIQYGYTWCLRFTDGDPPHMVAIKDPNLVTCRECRRLYRQAGANFKHPLREFTLLDRLQSSPIFNSPEVVAHYCRRLVRSEQRTCQCLALSKSYRLIHQKTVAVGTLTDILLHPANIFTLLIKHNACGFILAQNHPLGPKEPDEQDRELTLRLVECSKLLQIPFYDHVILSPEGYYSLREHTDLWE